MLLDACIYYLKLHFIQTFHTWYYSFASSNPCLFVLALTVCIGVYYVLFITLKFDSNYYDKIHGVLKIALCNLTNFFNENMYSLRLLTTRHGHTNLVVIKYCIWIINLCSNISNQEHIKSRDFNYLIRRKYLHLFTIEISWINGKTREKIKFWNFQ